MHVVLPQNSAGIDEFANAFSPATQKFLTRAASKIEKYQPTGSYGNSITKLE